MLVRACSVSYWWRTVTDCQMTGVCVCNGQLRIVPQRVPIVPVAGMPLRSISPGAWLLGHFRRNGGGGDCVMVVNDDPSSTASRPQRWCAPCIVPGLPHCVVAHFPDRTRITTCCCAHCRGARGEPGDGGARGGGGAQRCARRGGVPPVLCGGQRAAVLLEQLDSVGVKTHGDSYHLQNSISVPRSRRRNKREPTLTCRER